MFASRSSKLRFNNSKLALAAALFAGGMAMPALGAGVTFSSAVATHDQLFGTTINPGSIDGNPASHGWGVFNGQFTNQSAVFTASAPVNAAMLHIGLHQNLGSTGHNIEEFRLAVTADPVPGFGSAWTILSPSAMGTINSSTDLVASLAGGNRIKQIGNSYLPSDTYSISAAAPFANITGFRLELFNTGPNVNGGPNGLGVGSVNGNLVLSEFTVDDATPIATVPFVPNTNIARGKPVYSSYASWPGQFASVLTDGVVNVVHPSGPGGAPNAPTPLGTFYEIDLDGVFDLDNINIFNRADGCCPERLTRFTVQVLDSAHVVQWSGNIRSDGTNSGPGGVDIIVDGMGVGTFTGQYIRIINNGGGNYSPQMSEVEAFGRQIPEPVTGLLLGLAALAFPRRRKVSA